MQKTYSCLIVDDEELARKRLRRLLQKHSRQINVSAEFEDALSLFAFLKTNTADFILLDIEMPGINGIDALKKIPSSVSVIFTTAYKEFAIDAFEHDAFDYLLKPVSQERFDKAMLKLVSKNKMDAPASPEYGTLTIKEQFPVNTRDGIRFVEMEDISYFIAESKYVSLFTTAGESYLLTYSLAQLQDKLTSFCRIQKGLIVNPYNILEIKNYFNSRYKFIMNDKDHTELVSGRAYVEVIQALMKI
jgi:two-component system LytT family response regulator